MDKHITPESGFRIILAFTIVLAVAATSHAQIAVSGVSAFVDGNNGQVITHDNFTTFDESLPGSQQKTVISAGAAVVTVSSSRTRTSGTTNPFCRSPSP